MSASRQYCTFFLANQYFGLDVLRVQEIIRYEPLTQVPLAHPTVRGLMNLRGQIVTAIDLRRRIGLPDREVAAEPVNVVVHTDDGPVSLLVDEVGDVLELAVEGFEPPPDTLPAALRALIRGAYLLPDRLLLILDPQQAVSVPPARF